MRDLVIIECWGVGQKAQKIRAEKGCGVGFQKREQGGVKGTEESQRELVGTKGGEIGRGTGKETRGASTGPVRGKGKEGTRERELGKERGEEDSWKGKNCSSKRTS